MPIPGFESTNPVANTRFSAPVVTGKVADSVNASGPLPQPGGFICLQSTANLTNQIVSSSAVARGSYFYIPVITPSTSLVSAPAPPYVGCGAAMVYNDTQKRLEIWSSGSGQWLVMSTGSFVTS